MTSRKGTPNVFLQSTIELEIDLTILVLQKLMRPLHGDVQRLCQTYPIWLLDMNGTFMFGGDRFGPSEDYGATYAECGGTLDTYKAQTLISACFTYLGVRYPDPAYHESFPSVVEALQAITRHEPLPTSEIDTLAHVFAQHEVGRIPQPYAEALRAFAQHHRLALIADIWAEKTLWIRELTRAQVLDCFEVLLFSSDHGCVKPSPVLFEKAMQHMNVPPSDCIMIGDSARRDVGGAAAARIDAVWIGTDTLPPEALAQIPDMLALVSNVRSLEAE